jgi:hypothetical protein
MRGARILEAAMKITHVGPTNGPKRRRQTSAAGSRTGVRFAHAAGEGAGAGSEIAASAPLGTLGVMLALQEVPDPVAERRQAIAHGHGLLDELHQLRLDLIEGRRSGGRCGPPSSWRSSIASLDAPVCDRDVIGCGLGLSSGLL